MCMLYLLVFGGACIIQSIVSLVVMHSRFLFSQMVFISSTLSV